MSALVLGAGCLAAAACGTSATTATAPATATEPATVTTPATIRVSSPAFATGGRIPVRYTCQGADISPPLRWTSVPSTTKELALEMIDLNAPGGTFAHWVLAGIPSATHGMAAGRVPRGAVAGRNGFGKIGYGGPCPPAGKPHHYVIDLMALPKRLKLSPGFASGALAGQRPVGAGVLRGIYSRG
ncbi:MAG TPA: YbhB/YbcL family Raf kinase inhibitor-like protein [Solirubrobacteraceae bacterium]|nr:YbhB/YbcL family Raf kinase inhibitor-like protein [Solirubrobacteraceae bacterium]